MEINKVVSEPTIHDWLVAKNANVTSAPGKDRAIRSLSNTPRKRGFWGLLFGCVMIALSLVVIGCGASSRPSVTVAQYTQKQCNDLSSEVASWATKRPGIIKYVEDKHGTVTVKNVEVKHLSIQTIDGGNFVYGDGENISEYKLVLRFWWDGIIHANGHTDIGFVLDKDGKCVKAWTDDTDALIDLEDPDFWYGVGAVIGSML